MDCLTIYGSTQSTSNYTSLIMLYEGAGSPLTLLYESPLIHRLEEGGVETKCSLRTMEDDPLVDFDITRSGRVNKLILLVVMFPYLSLSIFGMPLLNWTGRAKP